MLGKASSYIADTIGRLRIKCTEKEIQQIFSKHTHIPWIVQAWVKATVLCFKKKYHVGAYLVAQWLRICLLMQGTRVRGSHMPRSN